MSSVSNASLAATQIVATMHGSLPMGGAIENTPIWSFTSAQIDTPFATNSTLRPQRRDVPMSDFLAFAIDDVVTEQEADWLVEASEGFGYRDEAPGIATPPGMRMNKTVHWVAPPVVLDVIFSRIQALLPQSIDNCALWPGLSHRINMYRYDQNDVFNRHIDGDWPGYGLDPSGTAMIEWPGTRSKLTMLLYLNGPQDGVQGGNTKLINRDGSAIEITPKKGGALFFRHGIHPSSVPHEGCRVTGKIAKYVARINVLYSLA